MRASPLCDGAAFTRGLEAAYRDLWRRWCDGRGCGGQRAPGANATQPAAVAPPPGPADQPITAAPVEKDRPRPLRYLVGPVSPERAGNWERPRRQGQCLAFNAAGSVDLAAGAGDTWEDVCRRLPAGWRPDFVALHLDYTTVPACLWSAPVPLVGLVADRDLQWHYLRQVLPRLDLVFTDGPGVAALRRAGWGRPGRPTCHGPERPWLEAPPREGPRDIDVLFVGNRHPAVRRERAPWLARLARLGERRRALIASGVFGAEYRALLGRARVVFNRSARGECNRRALEAAAAGALLFQEAGNLELPAYLGPGREYVAYTSEDLEGRLEHYLDHEAERRAIADAARARVREHSFESLWEREVLAAVEQEWPALQEQASRRPRWGTAEGLLARTWQALGASDGDDPALADELAAALATRPRSAALHNALGLALTQAGRPGRPTTAPVAERALAHFQLALESDPCHAAVALNLIEALVGVEQGRQAAGGARQVLAMLGRGLGLAPEVLDAPHFPPGFDHFRVEWERAAWANAGDTDAETAAKRDLLRWRLHALLADLTGDLAHFQEAAQARPGLPAAQAALGCALGRAGRPAEAVPPLRRAVEGNPFDLPAARALYQALCDSGDLAAARRLGRDRHLLSRAAPQAVPAESWFAEAPPAGDELASVIVLCCNEAEYTRLCLESVLRHTRPPYELVLVDNGSTDATPALLEELRRRPGPQRVEVLRNEANVGFPAGCNQGVAQARGAYVIFLNNDTVVTEGWLEGLVGWALQDWPGVGLVQDQAAVFAIAAAPLC